MLVGSTNKYCSLNRIQCLSFSFCSFCIGDVINFGNTPWFVKQPPLDQQQRQQPRDDGGVAFIQRVQGDTGGRGRGKRGVRGGGAGRGNATTVSSISEDGSDARSNRNEETHSFHCGEEGHWVNMFPLLLEEQQ